MGEKNPGPTYSPLHYLIKGPVAKETTAKTALYNADEGLEQRLQAQSLLPFIAKRGKLVGNGILKVPCDGFPFSC